LQPKVRSIEAIAEIIPAYISSKNISYGWFYSASFSPLLEVLSFDTVIYDCMDELSLFKGAPQQLIDLEKYLLSHADVVFTGGKSLYESKKQLHDNVYCFPSSVDQFHFAKALNGIAIPEDIAGINTPIVGYFGVIDERIDLDMIRKSAAMMPDVTFVMIGPLAKIHDEDLPRAENIRYLGMKSYEELPAYLKAFNVAMMPFALNESTIYISPTKTLEYMAAGKPIISTRIKDVVRDYSHCVSLVDNAEEFTAAVRELLDTQLSGQEYTDILQRTSWDNTAANMKNIIKSYN
jgi:glycosyltransferase involved in cell wall biosynthesis